MPLCCLAAMSSELVNYVREVSITSVLPWCLCSTKTVSYGGGGVGVASTLKDHKLNWSCSCPIIASTASLSMPEAK